MPSHPRKFADLVGASKRASEAQVKDIGGPAPAKKVSVSGGDHLKMLREFGEKQIGGMRKRIDDALAHAKSRKS